MTTSLQVLSAGVMRRIVAEVAATFHRETGCAVDLTVGTVGALKEQAAAGAPVDVLVLTDVAIDELTGRGIVEAGQPRRPGPHGRRRGRQAWGAPARHLERRGPA